MRERMKDEVMKKELKEEKKRKGMKKPNPNFEKQVHHALFSASDRA